MMLSSIKAYLACPSAMITSSPKIFTSYIEASNCLSSGSSFFNSGKFIFGFNIELTIIQ